MGGLRKHMPDTWATFLIASPRHRGRDAAVRLLLEGRNSARVAHHQNRHPTHRRSTSRGFWAAHRGMHCVLHVSALHSRLSRHPRARREDSREQSSREFFRDDLSARGVGNSVSGRLGARLALDAKRNRERAETGGDGKFSFSPVFRRRPNRRKSPCRWSGRPTAFASGDYASASVTDDWRPRAWPFVPITFQKLPVRGDRPRPRSMGAAGGAEQVLRRRDLRVPRSAHQFVSFMLYNVVNALLIDTVAVQGSAWVTARVGCALRYLQTGDTQTYAAAMALALLAGVAHAFLKVSKGLLRFPPAQHRHLPPAVFASLLLFCPRASTGSYAPSRSFACWSPVFGVWAEVRYLPSGPEFQLESRVRWFMRSGSPTTWASTASRRAC